MRTYTILLAVTACASQPVARNTETEVSAGAEHQTVSETPEVVMDTPDSQPIPPPELQCTQVDFLTTTVGRDSYDTRTGAGVTLLSALVTSHSKPLEECGLNDVLATLARLKCSDGSNPFGGDQRQAHGSRVGSMGAGGRCGSIIDMYRAPCPEATYEVYADMYFCPG